MNFRRGHSDRCVCVHADLLADLSASQLLAQADMFENDETAGNEFLLDAEVAMSPHA